MWESPPSDTGVVVARELNFLWGVSDASSHRASRHSAAQWLLLRHCGDLVFSDPNAMDQEVHDLAGSASGGAAGRPRSGRSLHEHRPRTQPRSPPTGPAVCVTRSTVRSPCGRTDGRHGSGACDRPEGRARRSGDACRSCLARRGQRANPRSRRTWRDPLVPASANRSRRGAHEPLLQLVILAQGDELHERPVVSMVGCVEQVVLPVLCISRSASTISRVLRQTTRHQLLSERRERRWTIFGLCDHRCVNGEGIGEEGPQPLGIDYGDGLPSLRTSAGRPLSAASRSSLKWARPSL